MALLPVLETTIITYNFAGGVGPQTPIVIRPQHMVNVQVDSLTAGGFSYDIEYRIDNTLSWLTSSVSNVSSSGVCGLDLKPPMAEVRINFNSFTSGDIIVAVVAASQGTTERD